MKHTPEHVVTWWGIESNCTKYIHAMFTHRPTADEYLARLNGSRPEPDVFRFSIIQLDGPWKPIRSALAPAEDGREGSP